jgi:hypothetical protein
LAVALRGILVTAERAALGTQEVLTILAHLEAPVVALAGQQIGLRSAVLAF